MAGIKKNLNNPNKPPKTSNKQAKDKFGTAKGPAVSGGRVVTPSGKFGPRTKKGNNLSGNKFVRSTKKAN